VVEKVVVVSPPMAVLVRVLLRSGRRIARDVRQWLDEPHEEGAREYEQQYEKAEWPHWKLEELPSMGTRPITRRPLAVGVDLSQGSSDPWAGACPIWGKGADLTKSCLGRFIAP
jgi:hypothetical protein